MPDENSIEFLFTGETSGVDEAFNKIESGADKAASSIAGVNEESGKLSSSLEDLSSNLSSIEERGAAVAAALQDVGGAASSLSADVSGIGEDVSSSFEGATDDADKLASGLEQAGNAAGAASQGLEQTANFAQIVSVWFAALQEHAQKLQEAFHHVAGATSAVSPEFAETMHKGAEETGALSNALSLIATPGGEAIVVIAGIAAVTTGAIAVLYEFATSAGDVGDRIYLMSQKTGIAAQNFSVLEVGASLAGTSLERVTLSVQMLQHRMETSSESTGKQGKALRDLHLDTDNANVAMQQLFDHLSKIEDPAKRSQEAVKLMGFRMGRDFGQVVSELMAMGVSIDDVRTKLEALGIDYSESGVKKAHELEVQVKLLGMQWEFLKDKIEQAAMPIVIDWLSKISDWLQKNQDDIIKWGDAFVESCAAEVRGVERVLSFLNEYKDLLLSISGMSVVVTIVQKIVSSITEGPKPLGDVDRERTALQQQWQKVNQQMAGLASGPANQASASAYQALSNQATDILRQIDQKSAEISSRSRDDLSKIVTKQPQPSSGGKGGGGRDEDQSKLALELQKAELEIANSGYKAQEDAQRNHLDRREISLQQYTEVAKAIETKRITETMTMLDNEEKYAEGLKKGSEKAQLDVLKKRIDASAEHNRKIADLDNALSEQQIRIVLATEQGRFSVTEEQQSRLAARVSDNVRMRVLTEEQAADLVAQSDLSLHNYRIDLKRRELADAGNDLEQRARIQGELSALNEKTTSIEEDNARRRRDARQRDIDQMRQYEDQMRQVYANISSMQIDTARIMLEHKIGTGGESDLNRQRDLRAAIDLAEEEYKFKAQKAQDIADLQVKLQTASLQEQARLIREFHDQMEAAENLHAAKEMVIRERYLEELHSANQNLAQNMAQDFNNAISEGVRHGVKAGLISFAQGMLQMLENVEMKRLEEQLTKIFDSMAGKGGIQGKIIEILTGVKKPGATSTIATSEVTRPRIVGTGNTDEFLATRTTTAINTSTTQQTMQLNAATQAQTQAIDAAIQAATEHLCACNQPQQESLLRTILKAAIQGAVQGAMSGGGSDGGSNNEGPTGPGPTSPPVLKPGKAKGGSFGPNEAFPVGEQGMEWVYTGNQSGYVMPNQGSKGGETHKTYNITLNAPVLGGTSHAAPRSRREYVEMLAPALQEALQ